MDGNFGPVELVVWPSSFLAGIAMCLSVYEITRQVSLQQLKGYRGLTKLKKVEWNNRGFSTCHALLVAAASFYLVVLSGLFTVDSKHTIFINRKSWLSDATFGFSLGYFVSDLAMILYYFPSLGGLEYVLHHGLSMYAISLALFSGQAHKYILMVIFTEASTPFVNLRWYLEVAGQKNSKLYLYNGLALFGAWLIARILLFVYFFIHMYLHFDQVKTIFPLGFYSTMTVPPVIAVMNVIWFWKILRGMLKTLRRKKHSS